MKKLMMTTVSVACMLMALSGAAEANKPLCVLKAGTDISGNNVCQNAKNAYNGTKTLIKFDSCTGSNYAVDVVFQQDPGVKEHIEAFQTSLEYDSAKLVTPTCTYDPANYFDMILSALCPASWSGGRFYVYGAKGSFAVDNYPGSNPNFVAMRVTFDHLNLSEGETSSLHFFEENPGRLNQVANIDYKVNDELIDADVICVQLPTITDNQAGDDTVRNYNDGVYNVDFIHTGGSPLEKFQVRACSTDTNCGNIVDWTDVYTGLSRLAYTDDWRLPDSVWSALPQGKSYISVRVFDTDSNAATSPGPLFYVIKGAPGVLPNPPENLTATVASATSIALSWTPPTLNTDGSPLTDLAGFNIYRGTSCYATNSIKVNDQPIQSSIGSFTDNVTMPNFTYYYYVTAVNTASRESGPSNCVSSAAATKGVRGSVVRYDTSAGTNASTGFPTIGEPGLTVILMDGANIVGSTVTDSDGKFIIPVNADTNGKTYDLYLVIPPHSGFMHEADTLGDGSNFRIIAKGVTIGTSFAEPKLPKLGAGPAVGDANCSGTVDLSDFVVLKNCYGAAKGEERYNINCDFNGSETVNLEDFVVLKSNYGKSGADPKPEFCVH